MTRTWLSLLLTVSCVVATTGCTLTPDGDGLFGGARNEREKQLQAILDAELERSNDRAFFSSLVTHSSPRIRRAAARALGRLQDASFVPMLAKSMATETDEGVIEELAFALGQIHDFEALVPLRDLLARDNWRLRMRAAEAIGKLQKPEKSDDEEAEEPMEDPVLPLVEALEDAHVEVRGAAALALWRHQDSRAIPHLVRHLDPEEDPEVRWRVAYALMKIEDAATLEPLFELFDDPNPWVRTFAVQGMGYPVPESQEHCAAVIEGLRLVFRDKETFWTTRVQAARSLQKMREAHKDNPKIRNPALSLLLEETLQDRHPLVLEALYEAVAIVGGPLEQNRLQRAVHTPTSLTGQRAAIAAYGKVSGDRGMMDLLRFMHDPDPLIRAATAGAMGNCGGGALGVLRDYLDPKQETDNRVRCAATEALTEIATDDAWDLVRKVADDDPDMAVRGTAVMNYCTKKPQGWVDTVSIIYVNSQEEKFWDVRQEILKGLHKEKKSKALSPLLKLAAEDSVYSVRQLAGEIQGGGPISGAGATRSAPYPILSSDQLRGGENPHITVETNRGSFVMELYLEEAPRHVSSIIYLARNKTYDGLRFHRVVPSFVIQGGDPRGDGWGAGDYFLPDEINPVPYLRGTLGMPKSTKDDGGCQIFVTHLPTPHLDGRYTVFGRVIQGMDVVDTIQVGDTIVKAVVDESRFVEAK